MYVKGLITSILGASVILGALIWANSEGFFDLEDLQVNLEAEADLEQSGIMQLYKMSLQQDLQVLKGQSLFAISASKINESLLINPWVEEVNIRRVFPTKLKVEIRPREWLAYLYRKQKFYPYTASGMILDPIPILQGPDLPLVRLNEKNLEKYKTILLNTLRNLKARNLFNVSNLQEISVDREGLYFLLSPNNIKVRLGLEDLDLRIGRVEKVLKYLEEHKLQGRVINADFGQKVVVKLRKAR